MNTSNLCIGNVRPSLARIGTPPHCMGYCYLQDAFSIVKEDGTFYVGDVCSLYSRIAQRYGKNPAAVERGIRYAIETAWIRGDADFQEMVFSHSISPFKGKPTNAEFIARSSEYLSKHSEMAPDVLEAFNQLSPAQKAKVNELIERLYALEKEATA